MDGSRGRPVGTIAGCMSGPAPAASAHDGVAADARSATGDTARTKRSCSGCLHARRRDCAAAGLYTFPDAVVPRAGAPASRGSAVQYP